jgi:hypothetical protein
VSDQQEFAKVVWVAGDIVSYVRDEDGVEVTVEQAEDWLFNNTKYIQDAMLTAGWDAIETLTNMEPPGGST